MRRGFILAMILIFVSVLSSVSAEEAVMLRNGITFNMTEEQVTLLETLPRDSSTNYVRFGPGEIFGIDNSSITYSFNDYGLLEKMTVFLNEDENRLAVGRQNYNTAVTALSAKYGEPLHNQYGVTHPYTGVNLGTVLPAFIELVDRMDVFQFDYEEWAINVPEGIIKIDCLYIYVYASGIDPYLTVVIEYNLFRNPAS